ncbi:hypothetical protein HMPREF0201_02436 [Cedecea davisae DSM 4568]|uniref:Uncharacterized protein n=1 Tax=Cedecea davisae DSM 4568 TaxID=566551 RepID=S3IUP0_9ENTR|nr:hypothetical protein HMPREF0201_02436 [Cedecea davisae DSM 4568]
MLTTSVIPAPFKPLLSASTLNFGLWFTISSNIARTWPFQMKYCSGIDVFII